MLGHTWEYVDNHLTVAQMSAYRKYWKNAPPVDRLAAAWMGFKPESEHDNDAAIQAIIPFFGGG